MMQKTAVRILRQLVRCLFYVLFTGPGMVLKVRSTPLKIKLYDFVSDSFWLFYFLSLYFPFDFSILIPIFQLMCARFVIWVTNPSFPSYIRLWPTLPIHVKSKVMIRHVVQYINIHIHSLPLYLSLYIYICNLSLSLFVGSPTHENVTSMFDQKLFDLESTLGNHNTEIILLKSALSDALSRLKTVEEELKKANARSKKSISYPIKVSKWLFYKQKFSWFLRNFSKIIK